MDRYRFGKESWAVVDLDSMSIVDVGADRNQAELFALDLAAKQDKTFYLAHIYSKAEPEKQPSRLVELVGGDS